jgi:hypothetical protein
MRKKAKKKQDRHRRAIQISTPGTKCTTQLSTHTMIRVIRAAAGERPTLLASSEHYHQQVDQLNGIQFPHTHSRSISVLSCPAHASSLCSARRRADSPFAWLVSHQPAMLFSEDKPATSQQYSSLRTNQHQPSATSQPNRL